MLGNYYLTRMIGYSQTGPTFLTRINLGTETYLLRFLTDSRHVKNQWRDDNLERFHSWEDD